MLPLLKKTLTAINLEYLLFQQGWMFVAMLFSQAAFAQNVGIGTNNPQAMLHVNGTIMAGHIHGLHTAQIDTRLAINSPVNNGFRLYVEGGHTHLGGNLNVANDGIIENNFRVNGRVGINGATNANYGLIVNSSNSYFQGNTITTGTATVNGVLTAGSNVSVGNNLTVTKDAIISENFRANGRAGIGGPTHGSYQLYVHSGNSYFQGNTITTGNATLQGNATIQGNLTVAGTTNLNGNFNINGKGHLRSEGSSDLRVGFTTAIANHIVPGGSETFITVNLPSFQQKSDIRVHIAQFEPSAAAFHTSHFKWYVYDVNPTNNTCKIRVINQSNDQKSLSGLFYIMTITRDV